MAPAAQGDVTLGEAVQPVEASTFTAQKAEATAPTQAAQGTVSTIAEAAGPTLTERATAAQRDTEQEQASLASAQDYEISDGAYVDAVTGKVKDIAPT